MFKGFPVQKPKTAKEKKALEEKKKREEEEAAALKLVPKTISNEQALYGVEGWKNTVSINKKFAVGTVASSKYDKKVEVFNKVQEPIAELSNLHPLSCYFGPSPDPSKDRFDRRTVKQLNDIDFSDDDEDDFEDVRNIKRQRKTILTEENLKKFLSHETKKANLEHHIWLKDSFVNKIGKMAPNLQELNIRRINISNLAFEELGMSLTKIHTIDISENPLIEDDSLIKFFTGECGPILRKFEAQNCQLAITDNWLKTLTSMETNIIEHLDVSFSKLVTDEGLLHFEGKKFGFKVLRIQGMIGVTGLGLYHLVWSCKETLEVIQAGLMDQEGMNVSEWGKALGHCFKLQSLDLSGNKTMGDDFFSLNLFAVEVEEGKQKIKPGLPELHTVKLNFVENLLDNTALAFLRTSELLENLELAGCKNISDYIINKIWTDYHNIKFVDLNYIAIMTPTYLEQLKEIRPDILMRRYKIQEVDPKDNMLRVPLRTVEKKKKGKKGKKKKKK